MRSPVLLQLMLPLLFASSAVLAQDDAPSAGDREVETVPVRTGEDAPPEEPVSATYSTIGISSVDSGFDNVKNAINLESTLIGLRIPTLPWIAVELNAGFTMIPGQVDTCGGFGGPACGSGDSLSNDEFVAHMFGVYGVFRSPGTFFAMAKIGYRYLNSSLPEFEEDRSGDAWSAGAGYRWSRDGFAELQYTKVNDDLNTIGITFSFSPGR